MSLAFGQTLTPEITRLFDEVGRYKYGIVEVALCEAFNNGAPKMGYILDERMTDTGRIVKARIPVVDVLVEGVFGALKHKLDDVQAVLEGLVKQDPAAIERAQDVILPLFNLLTSRQSADKTLSNTHHTEIPQGHPENDTWVNAIIRLMTTRYP